MAKRPGDDDGDLAQHKQPRIPINEAEQAGRRKQSGSSRTGQACDRCKIRKIRCDARVGGCSPCAQNNSECKTTDRITGRATTRGHTEHLENENASLRLYTIELQAQLKEKGIEPRPPPLPPQAHEAPVGYTSPEYGAAWGDLPPGRLEKERKESQASLLPAFRSRDIGENYLGVASENAWLSPIEGSSLALFGTTIDIAEFMPAEPHGEAIATAYDTFVDYAFGAASASAPQLPDYESCKVCAEWYFRYVQSFIPILHKPDFMRLLADVYHRDHQMTPAETVMVHMVLAVLNFQWFKRNGSDESGNKAFAHYHYSLTMIPTLIKSHTLEDLQGLALICSQLRNQSRPGAAYMFVNMVMGLAIESGLHRSATAWPTGSLDPDTIEMRKRVFWSLNVFHVTIGGKLGRPMPLRHEDFDIELPDPVPDNVLDESDMAQWKKCSFHAAITGFKVLKILMKIYSTIYSVRNTAAAYEVNVRQLEKELSIFQSQIPAELDGGPHTREEDRVSAFFLQISEAECQLLLHHPSLCRSSLPATAANNLEICLQASSKILGAAVQLKELKSLDTGWYSTNYVAAIFTTLFAYTEKRDQLVSSDVQRLRQEMDQWLDVMGEVGNMMGSGPRLQEAIRNIVDHSLDNITRHLAAKTASAVVASTASPGRAQDHTAQQSQPMYETGQYYNANHQPQYPPAGYSYTSGQPGTASYPAPPVAFDDATSYHPNGSAPHATIEAQLHALQQQPNPTPQPAASFIAAFQSPPQPQPGFPAQFETHSGSGPAAWRDFTETIMTNMGNLGAAPHDYAPPPLLPIRPGAVAHDPPIALDAAVAALGMHLPDGPPSWPLLPYGGNASPPQGGNP